jgi:uncharacterized protein YjbI with pentapeptide repeats
MADDDQDTVEGREQIYTHDLNNNAGREQGYRNVEIINNGKVSKQTFRRIDFRDASIRHCTFEGCDFGKADFTGADLAFTTFRVCNLKNANLTDSNCRATKFVEGTQLLGTCFDRANLHQANLEGAAGLTVQQLGGTDVSRATLPAEIASFDAVGQAQEISKNARTIFLGMIGGCVFSWLTIATTTDTALLTNAASTPLPIIGTNVPIAYFFLAAPVILLALFIYLHLYLQRLWSALADLPAIFVDGRRLDERVYPWLLTSFATAQIPRLRDTAPVMARFQMLISVTTAWFLVPVTCSFFWARFAWAFFSPGYYPVQATLSTAVLLAAIYASYWFYRNAEATFVRNGPIEKNAVTVQMLPLNTIQTWTLTFGIIASLTVLIAVKGHFNGADFREASLNGADLSDFSFERGYFFRAEANGASFDRAVLTNAVFAEAKLQRATFREAKATGANFIDADLTRAELFGAELVEASFYGANLNGADMGGVTNLKNAEFTSADLTNANLRSVDLSRTRWNGAVLDGADLTGADLSEAIGLTQEMLDKACADPPGSAGNPSRSIILPAGLMPPGPCE